MLGLEILLSSTTVPLFLSLHHCPAGARARRSMRWKFVILTRGQILFLKNIEFHSNITIIVAYFLFIIEPTWCKYSQTFSYIAT